MIVVMTARSKRDNFLFNKITEAEKKTINVKKKYQNKPHVNSSLRKMQFLSHIRWANQLVNEIH